MILKSEFNPKRESDKIFLEKLNTFVSSGTEHIGYLDDKNENHAFVDYLSKIYLKTHAIETDYLFKNRFNIEYASSSVFTIPIMNMPWEITEDYKNIKNEVICDLIYTNLSYFKEIEGDMNIISEGFSDRNYFNRIFKEEIINTFLEKSLIISYLPYFENRKYLNITSVQGIILNILKMTYFQKDKVLIFKIDEDIQEILKNLERLPFSIKILESNEKSSTLIIGT